MKEVVHVPTRELAEEVLRVAKEQGLMEILDIKDWEYYKTETYFRPQKYSGYTNLSSAKANGYKIITAKEFLNRYKPKFRPIAMKCNQEQFEAVKDKLVGCCLVGVSNFTKNIYLVNNFLGAKLNISNVVNSDLNDRQVFEEWNEKTFLECCDIEVSDEVNELNQLRKENYELKEKLKAIEDQPKVGDVCLFWESHCKWSVLGVLDRISINGGSKGYYSEDIEYEYCVKATPENIKAKIKELEMQKDLK